MRAEKQTPVSSGHKWDEINVGIMSRQWICRKCRLTKKRMDGQIIYRQHGNKTEFKTCMPEYPSPDHI